MTDLDFDELDKAVSNLMTGVDTSKRAPGLDDPEDKVVSLSDQMASRDLDRSGQGNLAKPETARDVPEAAESSAVPASLALKRRGQFMDIVRPGSMAAPITAPVSRQGASLQPTIAAPALTSPEVPPAIAEVDHVETPAIEDSTPEMPIDDNVAVLSEPVIKDETPTEAENSSTTSLAADIPSEPVTESVASKEAEEPLVSPFLPDAKVDKRPLGSPIGISTPDDAATIPVSEETTEIGDVQPTEQVDNTPEQPSAEAAAAPVVALPDELNAEIMELESTNTGKDEIPPAAEAEVAVPIESQQPSAGGSIQQQYKEQPSSGMQTNGAIFDTATYHTAVDTPAKKKSSLIVWLAWALVLLAIGAAAGAAYFYWSTHF